MSNLDRQRKHLMVPCNAHSLAWARCTRLIHFFYTFNNPLTLSVWVIDVAFCSADLSAFSAWFIVVIVVWPWRWTMKCRSSCWWPWWRFCLASSLRSCYLTNETWKTWFVDISLGVAPWCRLVIVKCGLRWAGKSVPIMHIELSLTRTLRKRDDRASWLYLSA